MNWEVVAALSQAIGTVVVVASVVYLAVQVRQNTNAVRSATRTAWLGAIQTCNGYALENSDIWHKGAFENQSLDGEELTRYLTIVHAALNAYEALYSEYLAGNVEEAFWAGKVRQMAWVFSAPAGRHAWDNYVHLFDERFVAYVREHILAPRGASAT